ncbi:hypothetical protein OK016_03265 [Vibrio chagasii]|nr:hypothetical protein [Vibrio chagasii]
MKWKLDGKHEAITRRGAAYVEALSFMVETILASKPELKVNLALSVTVSYTAASSSLNLH